MCIGEELVVDFVKFLLGCALVAEDLDDLLAVHHLFDVALNLAERLLLAHKERSGLAADCFRGAEHKEDTCKDDQHQRHAVIEHDEQQAQHDEP